MPNPPEAFSVEIDCSPLPTSVKRKWEKARQGEEKDSEKVKFALEKKMEQAEKRREVSVTLSRHVSTVLLDSSNVCCERSKHSKSWRWVSYYFG